MNIKLFAIWLLLISFSLTAPLFAQIYKYRDTRGHIVFTDDLSKVPPDKRSDVQKYQEILPGPNDAAQTPAELIPDETHPISEKDSPPEKPGVDETERKKIGEQRQQLEDEYLRLLEQKKNLEQEEAAAAKRYRVMEDKARYRIKRNRLNREIDDLNKIIAGYEKTIQTLDAKPESPPPEKTPRTGE